MRCPSPEWPRLAIPAARHNASGMLTRKHLSTPNRLRENARPGGYARFAAFAGNGLIGEAFTMGVGACGRIYLECCVIQ